jgi:hypothetical protein
MKKIILGAVLVAFINIHLQGQSMKLSKANLTDALATSSEVKIRGKKAIKVVMDSAVKIFDEPTFAKLIDMDFKDGVIEVEVLSKFLPDAPDWARGFIGVTFRIAKDNSRFESIYIRPDNGRNDDQVRRNHSIQYYAYPDFKFDRLRKEEPEKYESYADMVMNQWIKMKIVVKGKGAQLYLNSNEEPALIVTDMKHGDMTSGSVGLWVGPGTEGYFRNLKVTKIH